MAFGLNNLFGGLYQFNENTLSADGQVWVSLRMNKTNVMACHRAGESCERNLLQVQCTSRASTVITGKLAPAPAGTASTTAVSSQTKIELVGTNVAPIITLPADEQKLLPVIVRFAPPSVGACQGTAQRTRCTSQNSSRPAG